MLKFDQRYYCKVFTSGYQGLNSILKFTLLILVLDCLQKRSDQEQLEPNLETI